LILKYYQKPVLWIRSRIRNSRVPDPGPYPKMDVHNINKNHQEKGLFHIFDHFYSLNLTIL
jgi:hypothetical protein